MKLNAVKCDQCKKIYYGESEWDGFKFWRLEVGGTYTERAMHDRWSYDFCSLDCLQRWVNNYFAARKEGIDG